MSGIGLSLVAKHSDNIATATLQDMYDNIEAHLPDGYKLHTKCTHALDFAEVQFHMKMKFNSEIDDLKFAKCPLKRD